MARFDVTSSPDFKNAYAATDERFRMCFEESPRAAKQRFAPQRARAVEALKAYVAFHHGGQATAERILLGLRDGVASRADWRQVLELANLGPQTVGRVRRGDAPEPTTASLQVRYELVAAFGALLDAQGVLRTALNGVVERLSPPKPQPTSYAKAVASEAGEQYEVVVERRRLQQYVFAHDRGQWQEWQRHVVPVAGRGAQAKKRAELTALQILAAERRRAYVSSREAGGGGEVEECRAGVQPVNGADPVVLEKA